MEEINTDNLLGKARVIRRFLPYAIKGFRPLILMFWHDKLRWKYSEQMFRDIRMNNFDSPAFYKMKHHKAKANYYENVFKAKTGL
ncbi:MAG: hypothetical protein DWQ44_00020 [Bacteroidetes bacterium]|nr:MAG: hypothetical protein DWQ33_04970 [Bacteroidota bacterium]REK06015.1 MAG: hypothetical protein DWQ39_04110 [Bacteroidota bacterium]REK37073.1 MAG: hypothetical protein DWQ44_00020 [Bacteroidota bacterium]REK47534.1 MAG: hypothetical protein DWQ48_12425 [Bacteroidota bacterium]